MHSVAVAANWRAFHVGMPQGSDAYVYRYRDFAGNLIYVGMTENPAGRPGEHLKESDWTSWVASVEHQRCRSRAEGFKLETKIRNKERPLFVSRTGYAALMAKLDEKYQTNHVAGVCACAAGSRHQEPSGWPEGLFLRSLAEALRDEQNRRESQTAIARPVQCWLSNGVGLEAEPATAPGATGCLRLMAG